MSDRSRDFSGAGRTSALLAALAAFAIGASVSAATLELQVVGPAGRFDTGDQFVVQLSMKDLEKAEAAGFQAFLSFNDTELTFVEGMYTEMPFGQPLLPVVASGNLINLAAGVDTDQEPSSADAVLVMMTFEAAADGLCVPDIQFRDMVPPTRLTELGGVDILPLELDEFPVPACAADIDFSGEVGFQDLLTVLASWNVECPGDVNRDGTVNFTDLLSVLAAWGPCI